ncbi:MAG: DEAD/DEAH box helicase, partial [Lachnospiraceae bacterium]|nr:DEAD/DEAH box helicase [Lachnospiraceae bacterium]
MEVIKVSVRSLVEFILRSGDIDNRRGAGSKEEAMQAGSRLHRKLQKRMGAAYRAEVPLVIELPGDGFVLRLEGRADGILEEDDQVVVDEIKGMYKNVLKLTAPIAVHLAQAKCYAYMYAVKEGLAQIVVQMTYANLETEQIKYFRESYAFDELKAWFDDIVAQYMVWAHHQHTHREAVLASISDLEFPYEYRKGQRDMTASVYSSIKRGERLFVQAPTGIGKTMAAIFPSVKAIGMEMGEKLFYLTAKTSLAEVAMHSYEILRAQGLFFQTVAITAKEKCCPMEQMECNPVACPLAKGHYDRVNDAIYDMITHEQRIDRELIADYAAKHQVCPFELSLDVSLFADGIICDYNYAFDPRVNLKRYFGDGVRGDYIFLVDEAHNLVDRASAMYSAVLMKESFIHVKHILSEDFKLHTRKKEDAQLNLFEIGEKNQKEELADKQRSLISALGKCNKVLLEYSRACETYQLLEDIEVFVLKLSMLYRAFENYLELAREIPGREDVLKLYFDVLHFLNMYELRDDGTVIYSEQLPRNSFMLKLYCVNPAAKLSACLAKARATVFFSATMLPIHYYKELLSNQPEDRAIYIDSPFQKENRKIFIGNDVSSRYKRRGKQEYGRFCQYIDAVFCEKPGNYMVFFPSYQMLGDVYEVAVEQGLEDRMQIMCQSANMKEEERQAFLNRFSQQEAVV